MNAVIAILLLDVVSAPRCVTAGNGQLACGYQCTSNLDELACAQTPEGLCASTPSQVACWDPPPDVRVLLDEARAGQRDDVPRPQCITSLNGVACGFYCVQSGDTVACANTPMGACATRFGVVRCWDPPPEVRWAMEAQGSLQPASCARTAEDVACGYHCVTTLHRIKCAASPWGTCERHFDQLACWDPPTLAQTPSAVDTR